MTIALLRVEVRSARRVRLVFTNTLAGGAFSTSKYSVTCTNDLGPSPSIAAAFAIVGLGEAVELALGSDLVAGGIYTVTSTVVPAVDASTYTGTDPFQYANAAAEVVNRDAATYDADAAAFGVDLVWADDFLEDTQGDLAENVGLDCALSDIAHAIQDEGLPWDPTWGARLGSFVDAPNPSKASARGNIVAQLRRDDRIEAARVTAVTDDNNPDRVVFDVDPTFRGGRKAKEAISYAFVP